MKELRVIVAGVMWIAYLVFLWTAMQSIGGWVIPLALVLMIGLIRMTSLLYQDKDGASSSTVNQSLNDNYANEQEKRKRERIDNVLRDLSTEDLEALKQRLADGLIDDDMLEERIVGIGDDGELITKSDRDY